MRCPLWSPSGAFMLYNSQTHKIQMFSDRTHNKLIELRGLLNLSSSDFTEIYRLMKDAYNDGFDYGCIRSREEMIPLGTLADMTVQELVNIIKK